MLAVETEDRGAVRVVAIDRPDRRNALSAAVVDGLSVALATAEADPAVRALVLTGRGKAFCAGGDLAEGLGASGGLLDAHQGRGRYADLLLAMQRSRLPIVAAVNGDALGGGLGLAV